MRILTRPRLAALLLAGLCAGSGAQVIVKYSFRPPEMVRRVAIPANPAEKRLRTLLTRGTE